VRRAIFFDFDGTIADSEHLLLRIYDNFAKKSGWPKLTHKKYMMLRGSTPQEALRWAGVKIWQLPWLVRTGRREYSKHKDEIKLFPYMANTMQQLSDAGWDIYILSSNSQATVQSILADNGIDGKAKVLKSSSLFGKHKVLKSLLRKNRYDCRHSWMIGDEIRDIESAKAAGVNSIGVVWGLQSQSALLKSSPTAVAEKPADIVRIVTEKSKTASKTKSRAL
jgi:phosphoglycolate phosphatase